MIVVTDPDADEKIDAHLEASLIRYLATKDARGYLRKDATPWLERRRNRRK